MKKIIRFFNPKFYIEHYPRTEKYVARYGIWYLDRDLYSGIISRRSSKWGMISYSWVDSCEEAQKIIDQYKEQNYITPIITKEDGKCQTHIN